MYNFKWYFVGLIIFITGNDLSGPDNYDHECRGGGNVTKHDPPLLFDLLKDPGERWSIGSKTNIFQYVPKIVE